MIVLVASFVKNVLFQTWCLKRN